MTTHSDLLMAKQTLSGQLLGAALRAKVAHRGPSLSIAAAVEHASRNVHGIGIGQG